MLKTIRKKYKLTQCEMAEYIGVPRTTYQSWESGRRNPTAQNIERVKSFIRRVRVGEMADEYYKAISKDEKKPSYPIKKRIIEIIMVLIIVLILVILW